jgi:hypothetical protein
MNDRELLEAAAKAAGIVGAWKEKANPSIRASSGPDTIEGFFIASPRGGYGKLWRPLADDGDALRLAAMLRINIEYVATLGGIDAGVNCWPRGRGDCGLTVFGDDAASCTRRAIVGAAAALAEGK